MKGATVFSKLDASSGCWQIPVDDKTSNLLHLLGGLSLKEVFQQAVAEIIEGIEKTANLQDDIIIWGSNQEQHDEALFKVCWIGYVQTDLNLANRNA